MNHRSTHGQRSTGRTVGKISVASEKNQRFVVLFLQLRRCRRRQLHGERESATAANVGEAGRLEGSMLLAGGLAARCFLHVDPASNPRAAAAPRHRDTTTRWLPDDGLIGAMKA
jgi:hypothetical protein